MDIPNDLKNLTDDTMGDLGRLTTSPGDIQLDQERVDTTEELARISVALGAARQAMEDFKQVRGEYLLDVEKEAILRIQGVIDRSQDALAEADANHDKLKAIVGDMEGVTARMKQLRDDVVTMFDDFRLSTEAIIEKLDQKSNTLQNIARDNAREAQRLDDLEAELDDRKVQLTQSEAALIDGQRTLKRGFDELNARVDGTAPTDDTKVS